MEKLPGKNNLRSSIIAPKGIVIWLTGLSGSGKSTLAYELEKRLLGMGRMAYVLDGDNIRKGLNSDLGFSDNDRNENIRRVAEVAAILIDARIITITAFISPFKKMRDFARERAGKSNFIEVYVKASLETCICRDPKGLYKKALNGEIPDFTGINSSYEEPQSPDLIINTDKQTIDESTELLTGFVLNYLKNHD